MVHTLERNETLDEKKQPKTTQFRSNNGDGDPINNVNVAPSYIFLFIFLFSVCVFVSLKFTLARMAVGSFSIRNTFPLFLV